MKDFCPHKEGLGEQGHSCLGCLILDSNWLNLKLPVSWEKEQVRERESIIGVTCEMKVRGVYITGCYVHDVRNYTGREGELQ